ncbi:MAG: glycosyltransferase, partial [Bacteroidota bacterium]
MFTIITVAWNVADGLRQTLDSIFSQSYQDYECIVQDGGSTDGTLAVAQSFLPHDQLRVFSEKDGGIYDAMNRATEQSKGKWIIYLNAGDRFHDHKVLSRMQQRLKALPLGVVYGNVLGEYVGYQVRHRPAAIELLWLRKPYHHQAMFIAGALARDNP